MEQFRFFISYSRDDGLDFAQYLKNYLEENKDYSVFLDTSPLSSGASSKWKPKIEAAIIYSDFFILIITPRSIDSNESRDEYSLATSKRKFPMLFKYRAVEFDHLPWGLKDRNLLEFYTKEELVRIFAEKFRLLEELLKNDFADPFKVQSKLKGLKQEFDSIPPDYSVETIKSYADDNFIPIMTFLKKSTVFYQDEVKAIERILSRVVRLSQNIDEKGENLEEIFIKFDADLLKLNLSEYLTYMLGFFIRNTPEERLESAKHLSREEIIQVKQIGIDTYGEIITFYSYKGGTGRTMALSNVACILADLSPFEKGVLMIDWDLEAPGLHRFFFQDKYFNADQWPEIFEDLEKRPGLIDLFMELNASTLRSDLTEDEEIAKEALNKVKLEDFIIGTHIPNLSLLKAGRFDAKYSDKVNRFDWVGLYDRSPVLIRQFAEIVRAL